ncbi:lipopolysaccharide biosynthesis protein [Lederbergia lenta]|uniref:Polysaccharide biosynthesis protein n=1 Tax=Lederbergia lenta TaxID=1467 RepID=A0A2X4WC41_LEDLE|nr:oligosaccharide flippase family protein [Lederbergia lenta]MCM3111549.1 oligosaccharide flippase family protein [Lederbergia lenta]MEC2325063.1 oligosaccharide flippase family protein [Lederbergia lenta]SQI56442.1 polysaccharide biosynthesis protein [Lederbergia lenta]
MRIQNSVMNMFFGLSGQFISMIMSFIVRTVFIYTLGIEYLGVDGLFSSILIMLSLANLGFDTAMVYSLYRPLAEKDKYKIQALMNLYKKAYRIIGFIVLLIGLLLIPFLPYIMNGSTNIEHIHIIYMLFLIQSASSYYFVYKQSIIIADQRNHIISKIHSVFIIISNFVQIIILLSVGNYIVVLSMQLVFRIIENAYIAKKATRLYPFLKEKNTAKLSKKDSKLFYENLYSLFLYKISGVVINGTDNIVISLFIGITYVGIYSNYLLIITTLSTLLGYVFYSVTASVGNLVVTESLDKKYFIFRVINFLNFWIFGFCTVCLWNLLNPFITIWLGEQYVFNKFVVFAIVLNFFTAGMQNASTTFRETTGLFKKGKYRPILAAGINIVVSIILAKQIGIAGVFLGTVISRLCTYFWYDPYVIFKYVFQKSVGIHFVKYILFTFIVVFASFVTDLLASNIFLHQKFVNFALRCILCVSILNIIVYFLFRNSEEFKYLLDIMKKIKNKLFVKKSYNM